MHRSRTIAGPFIRAMQSPPNPYTGFAPLASTGSVAPLPSSIGTKTCILPPVAGLY